MLVDDQCGLGRRPVKEQLLTQSEHLRVDEGGRGRHPGLGGLGAAGARHGGGVGRLGGVAQHRVDEHSARPPRQLVASVQRLDKDRGALAEPALEGSQRRQVGEHRLELGLPRLHGRENAWFVPGALDRDGVAGCRHSGMLPCLRFGVGSRLARCISSARMR